jgi:hypothetical protein
MAEFLSDLKQKSLRQPDIATAFNDADNIERCLQNDGHRAWGWVIYRSTYKSDDDWKEFVFRLRAEIKSDLDFHGGADMLDSLELTIVEDKTLEGASTSEVRKKFKIWVQNNARQEQDGVEAEGSQRYLFCVQVDEESLQSVIAHPRGKYPPGPDGSWIKMIWRDWDLETIYPDRAEPYEAIEGCIREDVGWMRVGFPDFMVYGYSMLHERNGWYVLYCRPPRLVQL